MERSSAAAAAIRGALGFLLAACSAFPEGPDTGFPPPARGAVVSEHPLATAIGLAILEDGGNAADAAVATALALAVVHPQAGNLGGGGFAIWVAHDPETEPLCLDFRETAPAALTAAAFLDAAGNLVAERSRRGALAPGVPGSPHGLWTFHQRLGRLSFREVAAPAIDLAREGFRVERWLAHDLRNAKIRARLEAEPAAAALFYPGGEPLAAGDLLVQEELARTLARYARKGPAGFYGGETAAAIVAALAPGGGVLGLDDLARYESKWRTPLRGWFRGHEIITVPPPSSGGLVLLQVLSVLDGFPLDEERLRTREAQELARALPVAGGEPGISGRALHWWIEATRRAFADRAVHLGDPDFHAVPVEALLSPAWITERRVSIGEQATADVGTLPLPSPESEETTHLSVLDGEGNAVSLTTTLNESFGCGILVPGAGFLLNDELDDFALQPDAPNAYDLVGGRANALVPGKRPLSSMTPCVIRQGGRAVTMVLGSPGGPRIITAVLQVILRTHVYGQSLAEAIAAPRLHQQWSPAATRFETGWDALLLQDLRNRGHEIEVQEERFGSVQAIQLEIGGEPVAASDPRRGGVAGVEEKGLSSPARPPE
ncbi:MAG: gamma-glutamyltransferase family protein [Planctomycetota bacterium]